MAKAAPSALEALRRSNRLKAMAVLQRRGQATRAELARATGLSRTTISSLTTELLEDGLVVELDERITEGGRPATPLSLDPSSGAFLGISFGHTSVRVVLVNRSGGLLAEDSGDYDVDNAPSGALDLALTMSRELAARAAMPVERILGGGAAISAPLRSGHSINLAPTRTMSGWGAEDLTRSIADRFPFTVEIGNDANLGALAECTFGAGRGADNALYVLLSAGVGLGLWLHRQIYTGDTGTAGELGHVVVDPDGQICRCGSRGCLETVAGLDAMMRAISFTRGSQITVKQLLQLAVEGDPGVSRLLSDTGRAVGRALTSLCSVLDPAAIIIGGELAATGPMLLEGIQEMIARDTSPVVGRPYRVIPGELGVRAEALGAAALAMDAESRQMLTLA